MSQTIDLSQTTQMMRWLDDEHRKDKLLIAELQKRLDEQKELLTNQGRRLEAMEARLTATQTQLPRLDHIETNFQQTRTGQGRQLEELEARIAAAQTQLPRIDQLETNFQQTRTGQGRQFEELEARITAAQMQLPRIDQLETNFQQTHIGQGRQLEELEARITATQQALNRFDLVEAQIQQLRAEAAALLPKFEHELYERLDQSAQARTIEHERDNRAVHELRTLLEPIPEIQRRLDTLALEDRRLNEQFPPLHHGLEQLAAPLDAIPPRLQYLEEWGERLTQQISDIKLIEGRIKTDHAAMLETIRRAEEDQRQTLTQWSGEIAEHRRQVDAVLATLPPLDEVYEQARRVLKHYEGLDDELRAEQVRVAHMLELNEQRLKETLAAWRSEHEKNWDQYVINFDLYRKQQREIVEAIHVRLAALEQEDVEHADRWHVLRETLAEQSKRQLMELERARQELEASVSKKRKRG